MSTRVTVGLLAVLCLTHITAAGWSIARYESTLRTGVLYRVRVAPIDPADAFRGRYVAVQPGVVVSAPISAETEKLLEAAQGGSPLYVVLEHDADGFARAAQLLPERPPTGDYLEAASVRPQWTQVTPQRTAIAGYRIDFSFNRYYMNEAGAPVAQQRFTEAARHDSGVHAWVAVRVKSGIGVIEDLFIDGRPMSQ